MGTTAARMVGMGLLRGWRRRERRARRPDIVLERSRAEASAEAEEHDIDDMLNAIEEHRRRRGARGLGEELADDLERGSLGGVDAGAETPEEIT